MLCFMGKGSRPNVAYLLVEDNELLIKRLFRLIAIRNDYYRFAIDVNILFNVLNDNLLL